MGARIYNPATALFTSVDPVFRGGDTTYGYPNDPINSTDLSGESWNWWAIGEIALTVATLVIPGGVVVGIAVRVAILAYRGYRAYKLARAGIYVVRTIRGNRYVGQSSNIGRRLAQHVRDGKISSKAASRAKVYRVKGGKTRREVAEQRMINRIRGRGHRLDNKVNPIGHRRAHLLRSTSRS